MLERRVVRDSRGVAAGLRSCDHLEERQLGVDDDRNIGADFLWRFGAGAAPPVGDGVDVGVGSECGRPGAGEVDRVALYADG